MKHHKKSGFGEDVLKLIGGVLIFIYLWNAK